MSSSDTDDKKDEKKDEKKNSNKKFLKYFGIAIGVLILVIVIILTVIYMMNRDKIPKANNRVQSKVMNNTGRGSGTSTDFSNVLTNFLFI